MTTHALVELLDMLLRNAENGNSPAPICAALEAALDAVTAHEMTENAPKLELVA